MSSNENFAYQRLTQIYYVTFRFTGLLPYTEIDEANSSSRNLKNYFFGAYGLLVNAIYLSMFLGENIKMILHHHFELDSFCELLTVIGVFSRYVIIYLRRWYFLELMSECRSLWQSFVYDHEAETVRTFMKKAYCLGCFFFGSTALAVTSYIITAQIVRIPPDEANGTYTRILPFKSYMDVQEEPWYLMVSVLQSILGYSVATFLTGMETAGPFLILMACGYLKIVSDRLICTRHDCSTHQDELPIDKVRVCVQFHQATLKFCQRIEEFTQSIFFIQVLTTVYNMSLIAIKILEKDAKISRFITLFGYNLLQLFTCQWISQHLFDESEAVARAIYLATLRHRQFNLKANKMLLMMLLRAHKPEQLTAGGFVNLSLESFKNMIVNAFSFFTVLRSFDV